jgi:REP element-mobilizing transposase RayT
MQNPPRGPGRPPRLKGYDYRGFGDYFLTICTADRQCLFGTVEEEVLHLNETGRLVESVWLALPQRFPFVRTDEYVVMPNHFHGILTYLPQDEREGPFTLKSGDPVHLGVVVRAFKSITAVQAQRTGDRQGEPLWQRGYFEHVIASDRALERIRGYIRGNPAAWPSDRHNPEVFARRGAAPLRSSTA